MILENDWKHLGMTPYQTDAMVYRGQKIMPETCFTRFVPVERVDDLLLSVWVELNAFYHRDSKPVFLRPPKKYRWQD